MYMFELLCGALFTFGVSFFFCPFFCIGVTFSSW